MTTSIGFLNVELARWDLLQREAGPRPEALGLPFFEDERPLRGAAGLCDWRLGGRLSRLLGAEGATPRFHGRRGEQLLLPTGPRLPFARIVLYGLGRSDSFVVHASRDAARELLGALCKVVPAGAPSSAGALALALVPPGRSTGVLSARRALELVLAEVDALPAPEGSLRVVVLESAAGQKEAGELIRARSPQA